MRPSTLSGSEEPELQVGHGRPCSVLTRLRAAIRTVEARDSGSKRAVGPVIEIAA